MRVQRRVPMTDQVAFFSFARSAIRHFVTVAHDVRCTGPLCGFPDFMARDAGSQAFRDADLYGRPLVLFPIRLADEHVVARLIFDCRWGDIAQEPITIFGSGTAGPVDKISCHL